MPLNLVLSELDIAAALERELTARNRLMPPRWDLRALLPQVESVERWLRGQYRRGVYGTRAETVFADKGWRGLRPLSELTLADRVLYRALVEMLAAHLPEELKRRPPNRDFQSAPLQVPGVRYVSKTDVASFYEFVDHEILHDELLAQTGEPLVVEALLGLLSAVMGRRVGLPQVHPSSDVLGDAYIDPARRRLRRAGYAAFRYSDDFRIASPSLASARSALEAASAEVRELGLVLNERKTYTYGAIRYLGAMRSFSEAEERVFAAATGGVDGLEFLDGYEDATDVSLPTSFGAAPVAGPIDDDEATDDGSDEASDVDGVQAEAAAAVFRMWLEEDESEHHQAGPDAAITQSLLSRALPVLGAAGDQEPLGALSSVLRFEPALAPQVCSYISRLSGTGPRARTKVRDVLDTLTQERSFSTWQYMWLAEAAGSVGRSRRTRTHYEWLEKCVTDGPPALAATAAAALARLGEGEARLIADGIDRCGPVWRPMLLWATGQLDQAYASELAGSLLERILIGTHR